MKPQNVLFIHAYYWWWVPNHTIYIPNNIITWSIGIEWTINFFFLLSNRYLIAIYSCQYKLIFSSTLLSKDIIILTFLNRKRMIHWRRWHPHPHNCGESWIAPLITKGVIPVTSYPWPVVPFFSPTMLIPLPFSILYQRKPIKKEIIQWHAIIAMNYIAYKTGRDHHILWRQHKFAY